MAKGAGGLQKNTILSQLKHLCVKFCQLCNKSSKINILQENKTGDLWKKYYTLLLKLNAIYTRSVLHLTELKSSHPSPKKKKKKKKCEAKVS